MKQSASNEILLKSVISIGANRAFFNCVKSDFANALVLHCFALQLTNKFRGTFHRALPLALSFLCGSLLNIKLNPTK